MIHELDTLKKELTDLAPLLNAFKSEAVQLRLLELIIGEQPAATLDKASNRAPASKKPHPSAPKAPNNRVTSKARKRSASKTGVVGTLRQLLETKFFDKPKTIREIVDYCRHSLVRPFKANDFSGHLGRLTRNGELKRAKNATNQYEYSKA